MKEDNN